MYTEESTKAGHKFPVKDFLIKLVLIVIFVLLLMWLFPMPNMTPFYDSVYRNNINEMKEVAKDYYTNERLPKNVGDSVKMTLKEMESLSLILPFVDKDGKSCDKEASYVEVTRLDSEYKLTVTLSCPSTTNHVIEYMGCYDKCPSGCTEETTPKPTEHKVPYYEYQRTLYEFEKYSNKETWSVYSDWVTEYKEETKDLRRIERTLVKGKLYKETTSTVEKWSDWSGWSSWTKTKHTESETKDVETKKVSEKSGVIKGWSSTKVDYFSYRIPTTSTRKVLSCSVSTHAACGGNCASWTFVYKCSYQDWITVGTNYTTVTYYRYRTRHKITEEVKTGEWIYTDFMLEKDLPEGYVKTEETLKQYAYSTRKVETKRETMWSYYETVEGWKKTGNKKTEKKWSSQASLTGWTRTGNTDTKIITY